jgi:hypothetical protein
VMKRYPVDASNFENRSFLYATLASTLNMKFVTATIDDDKDT